MDGPFRLPFPYTVPVALTGVVHLRADVNFQLLLYNKCTRPTTEYTELQPLLSGVHSVMRVKLVLAGEGGGARPPPLITFTLTSKVAVYAQLSGQTH
jgi:hypothetical protein